VDFESKLGIAPLQEVVVDLHDSSYGIDIWPRSSVIGLCLSLRVKQCCHTLGYICTRFNFVTVVHLRIVISPCDIFCSTTRLLFIFQLSLLLTYRETYFNGKISADDLYNDSRAECICSFTTTICNARYAHKLSYHVSS
jgi:hypothetical protein